MLTLTLNNEEELHEYFFGANPPHDKIFSNTLIEIKDAIQRGDDIANIAEIYFRDPDTPTICMDCDQRDWIDNLTSALEYYITIEDYDKCSQIRDLTQQIQSTPKDI